jgi:3-oxoacyl-[acyl-carrier-protein] synthase III
LISARILSTASLLPKRAYSTRELVAHLGNRDPVEIEKKTGIYRRHWIESQESATDLGSAVLREALARAAMHPSLLHRVIFVTSTGGDMLIPANANAVCEALGLDGSCDGFDLNNACMGFLSALDLAARSVATGMGPVAIVVVETLSRFLAPENPRPYLVLADAAVAVIVGEGRAHEGFLAFYTRNRGTHKGSVTLRHPGNSCARELIEFSASHDQLTQLATQALMESTQQVLATARTTLEDVRWVVPHQPNGNMLEKIVVHLGVPADKVVSVVGDVGSVGAASMPLGLDRLLATHTLAPGERVLFVGVGAGMAYGAALYQVAP